MNIDIQEQSQPDQQELTAFFELAFTDLDDSTAFAADLEQGLDDWFSMSELMNYLPYGMLAEARLESDQLIGAVFIGKQHPLSWPDGHKMEVFILGVHPQFRHLGIAQQLMALAEEFAKQQAAKKILVNTHTVMTSTQEFYEKLGYQRMGSLTGYYQNGDAVFYQKQLT